MAGRGSAAGLLAFGNANDIVIEMAREVLPVVHHTPVLAGVNGTDPFLLLPQFLQQLKHLGFSGVQNFPTVGLFDGSMRQSFEETGLGFGLEVDMIAAANVVDLLTTPYVFSADEARAMTRAGADLIVAHMGVTTGGEVGARAAKSLDQCVNEIEAIAEAARTIRPEVFLCCAMAGRSRCRKMRAMCWTAARTATVFSAPARSNACRSNGRSRRRSRRSSR